MTYQYGTAAANAKLNALVAALGASATLSIFSGAEPANCQSPDPSGLLVTLTLPAVPFAPASAGVLTLSGIWSGSASASGTAASFRVYDSTAVCQIQGNTATDLILTNNNIALGKSVTITTFTITSGNL